MLANIADLPPVLQEIVTLDALNEFAELQHAPWPGRLLAASILRQAGVATGAHLTAVNLGIKSIPVDRRRQRSRNTAARHCSRRDGGRRDLPQGT